MINRYIINYNSNITYTKYNKDDDALIDGGYDVDDDGMIPMIMVFVMMVKMMMTMMLVMMVLLLMMIAMIMAMKMLTMAMMIMKNVKDQIK